MDKNIETNLKDWVKANYKQYATGWTWERSEGNFPDVFNDGYDCATAWAAYDIGTILGMKLEEPERSDEEDDY